MSSGVTLFMIEKQPFSVIHLQNLPHIPQPSEELRRILRSCEGALSAPEIEKRKFRKRKGKGKLNGFIAFRAFYTKAIKDPKLQIQLSQILSKVWENEPNRSIWNCYALRYNETANGEEFMHWLYRNLGLIKDSGIHSHQVSRACKSHILSNVEDVFLETPT